MSVLLYAFNRELFCVNIDDYEVENGYQLKRIASEYCGVSDYRNVKYRDTLLTE